MSLLCSCRAPWELDGHQGDAAGGHGVQREVPRHDPGGPAQRRGHGNGCHQEDRHHGEWVTMERGLGEGKTWREGEERWDARMRMSRASAFCFLFIHRIQCDANALNVLLLIVSEWLNRCWFELNRHWFEGFGDLPAFLVVNYHYITFLKRHRWSVLLMHIQEHLLSWRADSL